jgi:predicted molibdopterin-dependent oxidoreductase YjgC
MKEISKYNYKGKTIFLMDVSHLRLNERADFKKIVEHAKAAIQVQPHKSVLIITDVTDTKFDREIVESFKDYAKHNNPFIKASALVGLSGMQKVIFYAVKTFTGRDFYLAKDFADAQEWLIRQ